MLKPGVWMGDDRTVREIRKAMLTPEDEASQTWPLFWLLQENASGKWASCLLPTPMDWKQLKDFALYPMHWVFHSTLNSAWHIWGPQLIAGEGRIGGGSHKDQGCIWTHDEKIIGIDQCCQQMWNGDVYIWHLLFIWCSHGDTYSFSVHLLV